MGQKKTSSTERERVIGRTKNSVKKRFQRKKEKNNVCCFIFVCPCAMITDNSTEQSLKRNVDLRVIEIKKRKKRC